VCQRNPALAHHLNQVARAQLEAKIPPDTEDNDLLIEMPPFEQSESAAVIPRHYDSAANASGFAPEPGFDTFFVCFGKLE
jgi:hypothetical protein